MHLLILFNFMEGEDGHFLPACFFLLVKISALVLMLFYNMGPCAGFCCCCCCFVQLTQNGIQSNSNKSNVINMGRKKGQL